MSRNYLIVFIVFIFALDSLAATQLGSIELLKSEIKNKPWIENNTLNDPTGMNNLSLMLSLGGKYLQLPFLMSDKSKLMSPLQVPALQQVIDEAYGRIFSTPTGRRICQIATLGNEDLLVHQFGVSRQFAKIWSQECSTQEKSSLSYRPDIPRSYVLIYTEEKNHPAEGWTNAFGVTFLTVLPDEITIEHFIKILSHELAVRFDKKETIGSWYQLNGVEKGNQSECEILKIIRNPVIKYAFVSSRARQFENQILTELGKSIPANNQSCVDQIQNEIPGIVRLIPLVQPEILIQRALADTQKCSHQELNWLEGLKTLDKLNLCTFFNTPDIGENTQSPTVGGPRPRVTGGWGDELKQSESISKSEDLNKWLMRPDLQNTYNYKAWDTAVKKQREFSKQKSPVDQIKSIKDFHGK